MAKTRKRPKKERQRGLQGFFFRGLVTVLPVVLTVVVFGLIVQGLNQYVVGPINRAIYWSLEHPRLAAVRSIKGGCLARTGHVAEAESLLLASHEQITAGQETVGTDARDSARRIADLYERWGKPGRAEPYRLPPGSDRAP